THSNDIKQRLVRHHPESGPSHNTRRIGSTQSRDPEPPGTESLSQCRRLAVLAAAAPDPSHHATTGLGTCQHRAPRLRYRPKPVPVPEKLLPASPPADGHHGLAGSDHRC